VPNSDALSRKLQKVRRIMDRNCRGITEMKKPKDPGPPPTKPTVKKIKNMTELLACKTYEKQIKK
jgi:hypothetical protein